MSNTLDDILNVGIPIILILIVFGFLYIKLLDPYVVPMFSRFFQRMRERKVEKQYSKEVVYE